MEQTHQPTPRSPSPSYSYSYSYYSSESDSHSEPKDRHVTHTAKSPNRSSNRNSNKHYVPLTVSRSHRHRKEEEEEPEESPHRHKREKGTSVSLGEYDTAGSSDDANDDEEDDEEEGEEHINSMDQEDDGPDSQDEAHFQSENKALPSHSSVDNSNPTSTPNGLPAMATMGLLSGGVSKKFLLAVCLSGACAAGVFWSLRPNPQDIVLTGEEKIKKTQIAASVSGLVFLVTGAGFWYFFGF